MNSLINFYIDLLSAEQIDGLIYLLKLVFEIDFLGLERLRSHGDGHLHQDLGYVLLVVLQRLKGLDSFLLRKDTCALWSVPGCFCLQSSIFLIFCFFFEFFYVLWCLAIIWCLWGQGCWVVDVMVFLFVRVFVNQGLLDKLNLGLAAQLLEGFFV